MEIKRICVFCGAKNPQDREYNKLAVKCGEYIAKLGLTLVYGGGNTGLMGDVSNAALTNGARVVGFYPFFLNEREPINPEMTEQHIVGDMFKRKEGMFANSDAFLILPGGIGTLDEVFEAITLKTHNQLNKPIIFINYDGFWNKMVELLNHMIKHKFVHPSLFNYFIMADSLEEAFEKLGYSI